MLIVRAWMSAEALARRPIVATVSSSVSCPNNYVMRTSANPSAIVADMRQAVRFIRQHAGEYGVDSNRIGVFGSSAGGQLALLLGTTADSGDRSASDAVLRESSRVAAVVAYFPPTDLSRWENRRAFPATALTEAEAAQDSPIHCVSPGAAPSLIVPGDAEKVVPMVDGWARY